MQGAYKKMEEKPLLSVRGLSKYFSVYSGVFRREVARLQAVRDASFNIYPGEIVGMVGESGCGKSTVGKCLLRLMEPNAGEIWFKGENICTYSSKRLLTLRKEIQMIFQDPYASLSPRKTVADNLGEALSYHGFVSNESERTNRILEVLKQVGLPSDILNRYPHEFSGGQQQRICIGRAIAVQPKLIVCDEAVSALDVSVQAQILELLRELKEDLQLSYLFISHDLSVIRHLCDRVIVLYLGKVVEEGTCEEVFSSPKHPYTQALLSAVPKSHPRDKRKGSLLQGELPSPLNPPSGCPFITRCPHAMKECGDHFPKRYYVSPTHAYHCLISSETKAK